MDNEKRSEKYKTLLNIIIWGAIWGIFEATVGYLLHMVSFSYSWLIWYPVACFFMINTYKATKKVSSIFYVGLLCCCIKLLNLFLPGSIDRVINPAISIVFEAAAMVAVISVKNILLKGKSANPLVKALVAFAMNTGWRLLIILYLLFFVPDWIRNVSVISSAEKFIPFFITQNLMTSALLFIGYQFKSLILKPIEFIENRICGWFSNMPKQTIPIVQMTLAAFMLFINITLQFMLK